MILPPTSVYRLAVSLSLQNGLRISEVGSFPFAAIAMYWSRLDIGDTERFEFEIFGKGAKTAPIHMDGILLKELLLYAKGERAYVVASTNSESPELLLHPMEAPARWRGCRISPTTLRRKLRAALSALGLITPALVCDFEHGIPAGEKWQAEVDHRWHDLRHTFAKLLLVCYERQGVHDPMGRVQKQLRHARRETTEEIYAEMAPSYEANISDAFLKHLRS